MTLIIHEYLSETSLRNRKNFLSICMKFFHLKGGLCFIAVLIILIHHVTLKKLLPKQSHENKSEQNHKMKSLGEKKVDSMLLK